MKRNLIFGLVCLSVLPLVGCKKASSASTSASTTIRIGLECNYQPFNWTVDKASETTLPIDNAAGTYADGYDINFAKKLQAAGYDVKIEKLEWDSLIPNLVGNSIDAIIAGMTDTEEREKTIGFSNEYYRSELVFVTKKSVADQYTNHVLTSSELGTLIKNQPLESQISTVTNDVLDTLATNYGAIHNTPVDTFAKAASDVASGAAFAMSAEYPVAQAIVGSNAELGVIRIDQGVLGVDLASLGVSIGVRKEDTDLKTKLNAVLATYTQDARNADMTAAVTRSNA